MTLNPSDLFDEGLVYHADVPLVWRRLAGEPGASPESLNLSNEQTLRLLAAVEEFYPDGAEEHSQNHEYARLELKLNLLLELVSELLAAQRSLPPSRPLRINAHGVEWNHVGNDVPQVADRLLVEVFMSVEVPRPLRLVVHVQQVQAAADEAIVTASIEPMSEAVVDLLEKFIFRRHRRSIAHSRPRSHPKTD